MKKNNQIKKYVSIENVKCPICKGGINEKWFNFCTDEVAEFIAECWKKENPDSPRHIFYFQIEIPECVLVCDKDSKIFQENG